MGVPLQKKSKFLLDIFLKYLYEKPNIFQPLLNTFFTELLSWGGPFLGSMLPQYMALCVSFVSFRPSKKEI